MSSGSKRFCRSLYFRGEKPGKELELNRVADDAHIFIPRVKGFLLPFGRAGVTLHTESRVVRRGAFE